MGEPNWHDDPDVQAYGQMMQAALVMGRVKLGADKALSVALATIAEEMERHLGRQTVAWVLRTFAEGLASGRGGEP